jgi:hypothetical protein
MCIVRSPGSFADSAFVDVMSTPCGMFCKDQVLMTNSHSDRVALLKDSHGFPDLNVVVGHFVSKHNNAEQCNFERPPRRL